MQRRPAAAERVAKAIRPMRRLLAVEVVPANHRMLPPAAVAANLPTHPLRGATAARASVQAVLSEWPPAAIRPPAQALGATRQEQRVARAPAPAAPPSESAATRAPMRRAA